MRFEFRIRSHGTLWELRMGAYGRALFFNSQSAALLQARHAARLAWEDRCIASSVSVLLPEGVWQLDASHGDEPPPGAPAQPAEFDEA